MVWPGCFFCKRGLGGWDRTRLGHLCPLGPQQLLVSVVLFLPADIDLISRSGGIGVVEFPLVLHGRNVVRRKSCELLLLFRRGGGLYYESSLSEQLFFLRRGRRGRSACGRACGYKDDGEERNAESHCYGYLLHI